MKTKEKIEQFRREMGRSRAAVLIFGGALVLLLSLYVTYHPHSVVVQENDRLRLPMGWAMIFTSCAAIVVGLEVYIKGKNSVLSYCLKILAVLSFMLVIMVLREDFALSLEDMLFLPIFGFLGYQMWKTHKREKEND